MFAHDRFRLLVLVAGFAIGAAACSNGGGAPAASVTINPTATASSVAAAGMAQLCQIESGLQTIVADVQSGSISTKDQLMSRLESVRTQLDSFASQASSENQQSAADAAKRASSAVGSLEDALSGVSFQDVQSVAGTISSAIGNLPPSDCASVSPSP